MSADRINQIIVLGKKDFMEGIKSFGIYVVLIIAFLIAYAGFSIVNEAAKDGNVNIIFGMADIEKSVVLNHIFMLAVVFLSFLYLGINSVTTIAKERQEKTIEVLFYTPMDELSFIFGKYSGQIALYFYILLISLIFFIVLGFVFSMPITFDFVKVVILSVFLISCVISGGLLISTISSNISSSILILIGVSIGLMFIQMVGGIIGIIPSDPTSLTGIIKDAVSQLLSLTNYISPFAYLDMGWDAIGKSDNIKLVLSIFYSTAYSLIFLMLSVIILMKKGVKQ